MTTYKSFFILALFSLAGSLSAKVKSITSQRSFDEVVSAANSLSVILFYTEPNNDNLTRKEKKLIKGAIRYARKGFKNVSSLEAYKIADVKFGQVNLKKVPQLQDEFGLVYNSEQAQVVLFKQNRHIKTSRPFNLHKDGSEDLIYNGTKHLMDVYMANDINELIQEHVEHQKELEKARAEAVQYIDPYYLYDPFDYIYHTRCRNRIDLNGNCIIPYWRRRRYHLSPGFGFNFNF